MSNLNYNQTLKRGRMKKPKPLEIFAFFDPLSDDYWLIEPIIKKLHIEYGHYFTLRNIVTNQYRLQPNCLEKSISFFAHPKNQTVYTETSYSYSLTFLSLKTAELQGKSAGHLLLRKIQEHIIIKNKPIKDLETIHQLVLDAGLDLEEFKKDFHSNHLFEVIHSDIAMKKDMNVENVPALVLFNRDQETDGINTMNSFHYHTYVELIEELVGEELIKSEVPSLDSLFMHYRFLSAREISFLYNLSLHESQLELKKYLLKGHIGITNHKSETFGFLL